MYLKQNDSVVSAGRSVTYLENRILINAIVVEVRRNCNAELNNGKFISISNLCIVSDEEKWANIVNYEGRYIISSHGKVVSLFYKNTNRERLLKILSPNRYPSVALQNGYKPRQIGVNRLVAQHFLPPPNEKRLSQVMPKDGNHLNIHVDNLRWVDPYDLNDTTVLNHFHCCGEENVFSKLTQDKVNQIRIMSAQGMSNQSIAIHFGISRPAVSYIVNKRAWRTG